MSKSLKKIIVLISITLLLSLHCNGVIHNNIKNHKTAADTLTELELPLPNVPTTLRTPETRAAYIINHFWDAMDFRDTIRSHKRNFMEQNFANFMSIFPYSGKQEQQKAVNTLMQKAEADSAAYAMLVDISEKYLYEPNSPMLSEDYYILFLEQITKSQILGRYSNIRYHRQLDAARKNRPGMITADFSYTTREGKTSTLHNTDIKGQLLLIFYDPDCEHCKETMEILQQEKLLTRMVADKRLSILAVYSGEDYNLWKRTASSLPNEWIVGYDSGLLQENGSFVLRKMPTLYLIDSNRKVLLKDAPPEQIIHFYNFP